MKPSRFSVFLVISILFIFPLTAFSAEKTFRAGAATSDITSPLESKIIGGFGKNCLGKIRCIKG